LPARPRRGHGHRRPGPQGEPRRACAPVRLPGARRRELPPAHDRHAPRRAGAARMEAGHDHELAADGEDVLMVAEAETDAGQATMDVAVKIWRYDSATGDRELKTYEVEAPEWVTLLDVLDIIKDQVDGTLAYRKSCRMMICGSCGMRMDGAAVLACRTRMYEIAEAGHVPVISAMGNLPIVRDLVVDMSPFWSKMRAMKPWLQPGYQQPPHPNQH